MYFMWDVGQKLIMVFTCPLFLCVQCLLIPECSYLSINSEQNAEAPDSSPYCPVAELWHTQAPWSCCMWKLSLLVTMLYNSSHMHVVSSLGLFKGAQLLQSNSLLLPALNFVWFNTTVIIMYVYMLCGHCPHLWQEDLWKLLEVELKPPKSTEQETIVHTYIEHRCYVLYIGMHMCIHTPLNPCGVIKSLISFWALSLASTLPLISTVSSPPHPPPRCTWDWKYSCHLCYFFLFSYLHNVYKANIWSSTSQGSKYLIG